MKTPSTFKEFVHEYAKHSKGDTFESMQKQAGFPRLVYMWILMSILFPEQIEDTLTFDGEHFIIVPNFHRDQPEDDIVDTVDEESGGVVSDESQGIPEAPEVPEDVSPDGAEASEGDGESPEEAPEGPDEAVEGAVVAEDAPEEGEAGEDPAEGDNQDSEGTQEAPGDESGEDGEGEEGAA